MNVTKVPSKPSAEHFAVYEEIWSALNNSPEADEDELVHTIAEAKGMEIHQLNKILFKVEEYKIFVNERLFNGAAVNVSASIDEYRYEPTNDTVSVKLRYQKSLYSLAVAVRDCTALSRHVFHNMFGVKTIFVGIYDHEGIKIGEKEFTKR